MMYQVMEPRQYKRPWSFQDHPAPLPGFVTEKLAHDLFGPWLGFLVKDGVLRPCE